MRKPIEFVVIFVVPFIIYAIALPIVGIFFLAHRFSTWRKQLPQTWLELADVLESSITTSQVTKLQASVVVAMVAMFVMKSPSESIFEWIRLNSLAGLIGLGFLAGACGYVAIIVVEFCNYPKHRQQIR